jgi:hypothetical protein
MGGTGGGATVPDAPQWARVRVDANCGVRRGAWYEVLKLTAEEAVLNVRERPMHIARPFLQVVPLRPQRWSVVARPRDAIDLPLSWGSRYAVCPSCAHRRSLAGQPTELECPKCRGVFPVAWSDPF